MNLGDILKQKGGDPITVGPDTQVSDAIRLMSERRVGSVMVVSPDGEALGIFTERDVLNLLAARGEGAGAVPVEEVMTRKLVVAEPTTKIDQTLASMTENRCRHMPVLNEGKVLGVISIGDLVKAKLEEAEFEVESLREYISSSY
jgi:CBS domain-containing protein